MLLATASYRLSRSRRRERAVPSRKKAHLILNTGYENCDKIPFLSYGRKAGSATAAMAPLPSYATERRRPS